MRRKTLPGFWRDQDGGRAAGGLCWFLIFTASGGVAMDLARGFRAHTVMQAVAGATAVGNAQVNPPGDDHGEVLRMGEMVPAVWDRAAGSLAPGFAASMPSQAMPKIPASGLGSNQGSANTPMENRLGPHRVGHVYNAVPGSRSGGNHGPDVQKAHVGAAANLPLGRTRSCAERGGRQIAAAGDAGVGARDMGVNGISGRAGGTIYRTSSNMFGFRSGDAPNPFAVADYRLAP